MQSIFHASKQISFPISPGGYAAWGLLIQWERDNPSQPLIIADTVSYSPSDQLEIES